MTALYRHFSANGELLYVGISCKPITRLKQHEHDSGWASEIARVEIERFETRAAAMAAEREAIKKEKPRHNVVHARSEARNTWKVVPLRLPDRTVDFESRDDFARFLRSFAIELHSGRVDTKSRAEVFRWLKKSVPDLWRQTMIRMNACGASETGFSSMQNDFDKMPSTATGC